MLTPWRIHVTAALASLVLALHARHAMDDEMEVPSFRAWVHLDSWGRVVAGCVIVVVLWPSLRRAVGATLRQLVARLLASPRVLTGVALVALALQLLLWNHAPLPPDGHVLLDGVERQLLLVSSHPGERAMHSVAWGVVRNLGIGIGPRTMLAASSVLAGAVAATAIVALARRVAQPPLWLTAMGLGGWTAVFFGHPETYAWPVAVSSWAMWAWVSADDDGPRVVLAMGLTGLAATLHGGALMLVPVAVVGLIRRKPPPTVWAVGLALACVPSLAVLGVHRAWHIPWEAYARLPSVGGGDGRWFVPLWTTTGDTEFAPLWSVRHLTDVTGVLIRLVPGMVTAWLLCTPAGRGSWTRVPLECQVGGLSALVFAVSWNPDFGFGGDWDLFALAGLLVAMPVMWAVGGSTDDPDADELTGIVALLSAALTLPRWIGPALGLTVA